MEEVMIIKIKGEEVPVTLLDKTEKNSNHKNTKKMSMNAVNPVNGSIVEEYRQHTVEQILDIIDKSHASWKMWKDSSFKERAVLLRRAAEILRSRKEKYADLMTKEMGKLTKDGKAEIEKCAWVCDYYAENGEKFLSREDIKTDASSSYVTYNPLGVVLAVMPWNFPFWQVFRFLAPALMAGNGAVLKHASNVTGCSLAIEEINKDAGFPNDIFRSLIIDSSQVKMVIENPLIKAVTLTGSTEAGRSAASIAGQNLKKIVLELGGSDAYVVLKDADVKKAAETCVNSRLINAGQSCIAAKRFIVEQDIYGEFVEEVREILESKSIGSPNDDDTDIGPMARKDLRDEIHEQVQESIKKGANCLLGGVIPDREGAYYPPTLLTDVKPGMPAYEEEIFGPVASVIKANSEEDAIHIANESFFGLGAAIFTSNHEKGEKIAAEELEAGFCAVNDFVRSDPRLPFGGIKESGYGRELSSIGIKEFVNIKTVYVK